MKGTAILRAYANTFSVMLLYAAVVFFVKFFARFRFRCATGRDEDAIKRQFWRRIVLDREIEAYSLLIRRCVYISPKFFGDVFTLFPLKDEKPVVKLFQKLSVKSNVIDVGAHIGKYALMASRNANLVIAVEAEPRNFKVLEKNIKVNNLKNVRAFNVAASRTNGVINLYLGEDSSIHSTIPNSIEKESVIVESRTLDSLLELNDLKKLALIKIDVEGAEVDVLAGAKKCLSRVKVIIVEIHGDKIKQRVINLLRGYGLSTYCEGKFVIGKR